MKLICYLSLGYPSIAESLDYTEAYVKAGCDVFEVDFPAKNPFLDSPFIQNRMKTALANNDCYQDYMHAIQKIRERYPNKAMIILAYEDTVHLIGITRFVQFMKKLNLKDMILVGQKHHHTQESLIQSGINVAVFVHYHLPKEDIQAAQNTNGLIYLQAKPKNQVHPKHQSLKQIITYLKTELNLPNPIYVGVGIADESDVKMAKDAGAEAVFVGSAILKLQPDQHAMQEKIKQLKSHT